MAIWSPPRKRFEQLNYWERVRQTNESFLSINPFHSFIWLKVEEGTPCSCVKDTTEQADKKCSVCYGTKIVGGYEKYGYRTVSLDAQYEGLTIGNKLKVWTEMRPHRIVLKGGHERDEIITPYVAATNNMGWAGYKVDDYIYDEYHSGIDYYYQSRTDTVWKPLDHDNFPALTTSDKYYRFKIEIWRDNQSYKSPVWGMLQVRYQVESNPVIRLSRQKRTKDTALEDYGQIDGEKGLEMWTLDAPVVVGVESFIEISTGLYGGKRYGVISFTQSEHGDELLSQHFTLRVFQTNEIYYKVF